MKRELSIAGLVIILIVLSSVISAQQITVKTDAGFKGVAYRVTLDTYKTSGDLDLIDAFFKDTDNNGEAIFDFTPKTGQINARVILKYKGSDVELTRGDFGPYSSTERVVIDLRTENKTREVTTPGNETEINETVSNESVESEPLVNETKEESISGFAIGEDSGIFSKTNLMIYGGVILVLVIIFFMVGYIKKAKKNKSLLFGGDEEGYQDDIKVRKLSEWASEQKKLADNNNLEALKEAESKLRLAQDELSKLKKQDRITELRKKISDEERELVRLRRGE